MNQVNKDKERKATNILKVNIGVRMFICYPNIEVRRNKPKNQCFVCLTENHKTKHCKVPDKPCVHCGENRKHHRTLCPKKLQIKSTAEDQEWKDQPATGTESGMVAMGEKVVMQTALVSVGCNDKFLALFDRGSTRTYITEELAKMLKAKPIELFIRLEVLKQNKKRHNW